MLISQPSTFETFTKLTLLSCKASIWKHSAEEAIPGSDPASQSDCSRVFGNIWGRVIVYGGNQPTCWTRRSSLREGRSGDQSRKRGDVIEPWTWTIESIISGWLEVYRLSVPMFGVSMQCPWELLLVGTPHTPSELSASGGLSVWEESATLNQPFIPNEKFPSEKLFSSCSTNCSDIPWSSLPACSKSG